jgi:hypothetical protein
MLSSMLCNKNVFFFLQFVQAYCIKVFFFETTVFIFNQTLTKIFRKKFLTKRTKLLVFELFLQRLFKKPFSLSVASGIKLLNHAQRGALRYETFAVFKQAFIP